MSRSASSAKWQILCALNTLWIASYYCILCVSALEDDMMTTFNLSNTQFSLFATVSFGFAIISAGFTPYIIKRINLYNTMLLSTSLLTIGQTIFVVAVLFNNINIMYIGRIFIGIGYGCDNVTVYSLVNIWFENSKWLTFALNVVNSTFELSVFISRFAAKPLYIASGQIFVPYVLGIGLGFIAIFSCFIMLMIEEKFLKQVASDNIHDLSTSAILDSDFKKIKEFSLSVWLILIIIIIGWATDETMYTQFTLPYMTVFSVSESAANAVLSASTIYALTVGHIWGWMISKYGFFSYWLISAVFLMSFSMILLFCFDISAWIISPSTSMWIITMIYVIGLQYFYSVSYTCLYMICPLKLTSIVNTVSCVGVMSATAYETYLFGALADATGSYRWSILMMIVFFICALFVTIIVHFMDVKQRGPLHKKAKHSTISELEELGKSFTVSESEELEAVPAIKGELQPLIPNYQRPKI